MEQIHELIFATNNENKVNEIRAVLEDSYHIVSLVESGIFIDIPEPFDTIQENAVEKATVIYKLTGKDCFGEDTGLETEALNGEPGVKSARYAGDDRSFSKNITKLLNNLAGNENRRAQFRTVIALVIKGNCYTFEGICKGLIIAEERGNNGFGYDGVFVADGATKTFGEMTMQEKNVFNHRRKAVDQLTDFLKKLNFKSLQTSI
ncbi:MAG: RdgB/HAM1 family non-canonical purine NTP pyrophosphatase [Ginsengibacter sp.]